MLLIFRASIYIYALICSDKWRFFFSTETDKDRNRSGFRFIYTVYSYHRIAGAKRFSGFSMNTSYWIRYRSMVRRWKLIRHKFEIHCMISWNRELWLYLVNSAENLISFIIIVITPIEKIFKIGKLYKKTQFSKIWFPLDTIETKRPSTSLVGAHPQRAYEDKWIMVVNNTEQFSRVPLELIKRALQRTFSLVYTNVVYFVASSCFSTLITLASTCFTSSIVYTETFLSL